jgi:hypothetical protein
MENPASWKTAELIIDEALDEHDQMTARGAIGSSSVHLIADRLRRAGLLNDQDEPEVGWKRLRDRYDQRGIRHANRPAQDGSPVGQREEQQAGSQGNSAGNTPA